MGRYQRAVCISSVIYVIYIAINGYGKTVIPEKVLIEKRAKVIILAYRYGQYQ